MTPVLFAKNNDLEYVSPTYEEVKFTYDFYRGYFKKSEKLFISTILLTLFFLILVGCGSSDLIMFSILVLPLDVWLIICIKRYRQYIQDIKNGEFQIAYVKIKHVGFHRFYGSGKSHRAKTACLWYEAPDRGGEITTWTARIPHKVAKRLEDSLAPKRGYVISFANQMECMGVVWEEPTND